MTTEGMPEETILLAAASILRTNAVERMTRVRDRLVAPGVGELPADEREALYRSCSSDIGIAAAASKAADGIDDVIREASAAGIREELG